MEFVHELGKLLFANGDRYERRRLGETSLDKERACGSLLRVRYFAFKKPVFL